MSEYIVRMPRDMPYELKAELNAWYVNSEPIVRCRDCRWLREDDALWVCDHWAANIAWVDGMKPDGFCAWGERRVVAE